MITPAYKFYQNISSVIGRKNCVKMFALPHNIFWLQGVQNNWAIAFIYETLGNLVSFETCEYFCTSGSTIDPSPFNVVVSNFFLNDRFPKEEQ